MREEYLLWISQKDCKEFNSFEDAQKAANRRKGGTIEVLKVVGSGLIVDRYDVWSYQRGSLIDTLTGN